MFFFLDKVTFTKRLVKIKKQWEAEQFNAFMFSQYYIF